MLMSRIALTAVAALTALTLSTPAFAFQCPKLVKQLNDATAQRFDAAAANAKIKAAEANTLHGAGKHAEAEKAAKEGLDSLGIKS
jgi:ribosomal protein L35